MREESACMHVPKGEAEVCTNYSARGRNTRPRASQPHSLCTSFSTAPSWVSSPPALHVYKPSSKGPDSTVSVKPDGSVTVPSPNSMRASGSSPAAVSTLNSFDQLPFVTVTMTRMYDALHAWVDSVL